MSHKKHSIRSARVEFEPPATGLLQMPPIAAPSTAMYVPSACTRPRRTAWLLLVVYLLGLPGVIPDAMASLANLHGEHEVQVTLDGDHVDVVLHHDDHGHEHGLPVKLITGITSLEDDDDHVLHFASSSAPCSITAVSKLVPAVAVSVFWEGIAFSSAWTATAVMPWHAARPPPMASQAIRCLRTTVLVV